MKLFTPIIPEQVCESSKVDRICFLDIDGCLRHEFGDKNNYLDIPLSVFDRKFCKKSVSLLNECYSYVKYDIVVTSTWRNFWNITDLKRIFKENGISANIIGVTGVDYSRGLEIQSWISSYYPKNYIVIDDCISDIVKHISSDKIINPTSSVGLSDPKWFSEIVDKLS